MGKMIEPSKERWRNSFILGLYLVCEEWFNKKFPQKVSKEEGILTNIILLGIGVFWLFVVIFLFLITQFIEMPIRWLIFRGSLKDKLKHWCNGWYTFCWSFGEHNETVL